MEALKLYVVGESSGNPDDWFDCERAFVIASSPEDAARLVDGNVALVAEVDAREPLVLSYGHCGFLDE